LKIFWKEQSESEVIFKNGKIIFLKNNGMQEEICYGEGKNSL